LILFLIHCDNSFNFTSKIQFKVTSTGEGFNGLYVIDGNQKHSFTENNQEEGNFVFTNFVELENSIDIEATTKENAENISINIIIDGESVIQESKTAQKITNIYRAVTARLYYDLNAQ